MAPLYVAHCYSAGDFLLLTIKEKGGVLELGGTLHGVEKEQILSVFEPAHGFMPKKAYPSCHRAAGRSLNLTRR